MVYLQGPVEWRYVGRLLGPVLCFEDAAREHDNEQPVRSSITLSFSSDTITSISTVDGKLNSLLGRAVPETGSEHAQERYPAIAL